MTTVDVLLNRAGESVHAGQAHFTRCRGRRADCSGIPRDQRDGALWADGLRGSSISNAKTGVSGRPVHTGLSQLGVRANTV